MSIIRVRKRDKFVTISNEIARNSALSWEARGLLLYLLSQADGWEVVEADLLAQGPAGRDKVRRMLDELKAAGHFRRVAVRQQDGTFRYVTEIYEEPPLTENPEAAQNEPLTGKPLTAEPLTAEPLTANPTLKERLIEKEIPIDDGGDARGPAGFIREFDQARVAAFGPGARRPWPHQTDLSTAGRWINAGCDLETARGVFSAVCGRMAAEGKSPPSSLKYFDRPIADALTERSRPMPAGRAPPSKRNALMSAFDELEEQISEAVG